MQAAGGITVFSGIFLTVYALDYFAYPWECRAWGGGGGVGGICWPWGGGGSGGGMVSVKTSSSLLYLNNGWG
jgi:hypothetical protein